MYYNQKSDKNKPENGLSNENMYSQDQKTPFGPVFFEISPAQAYLDGLAPGSKRAMHGALERLAGLIVCFRNGHNSNDQVQCDCVLDRNRNQIFNPNVFDWHTLQRQEIAYARATLSGRYAPATANKILAALRGVLNEAWRFDLISTDRYHRLVDVRSFSTANTEPPGRAIKSGEVFALFGVCEADPRPQGVRDAAILGLLLGCGLRREEVSSLNMSNLGQGANLLIIKAKGNKTRKAPLEGGVQAALLDWLDIRAKAEAIALFLRIIKNGKIMPTRLTADGIYKMLKRRALQARIPSATPHDCRRTFISELLNQHDIAIVARLAGHKNIQTTARYDRRPAEAERRAAQSIHIPYTRRLK